MTNKTIVVLANSFKHHQHCVAGKCIVTKEWIRPVSDAKGSELSHEQTKYKNRYGIFTVKPKQKIIMGLDAHAPLPNQPENYVVDDSMWQQNYSIDDCDLVQYLDSPIDIWGEGDRISYPLIENGTIPIHQSLFLLRVEGLSLYKNRFDKRRATFTYNGINYDLAVTDPRFDDIVRDENDLMGIVCVSLGEAFEGSCYKLVATIF